MPDRNTRDAVTNSDIRKYKQRVPTKVDALKRDLATWLDQTSVADTALVSRALLETAFDRYIDLHDEDDARDLINRAFDRVARSRRGTLQ
jgi:hypothetical protein